MNVLPLINTLGVHAAALSTPRGFALLLSAPGSRGRFPADDSANHSSLRVKTDPCSSKANRFCLPSGVFLLLVSPPNSLRQKIEKA